jgi:hypothetical protein
MSHVVKVIESASVNLASDIFQVPFPGELGRRATRAAAYLAANTKKPLSDNTTFNREWLEALITGAVKIQSILTAVAPDEVILPGEHLEISEAGHFEETFFRANEYLAYTRPDFRALGGANYVGHSLALQSHQDWTTVNLQLQADPASFHTYSEETVKDVQKWITTAAVAAARMQSLDAFEQTHQSNSVIARVGDDQHLLVLETQEARQALELLVLA